MDNPPKYKVSIKDGAEITVELEPEEVVRHGMRGHWRALAWYLRRGYPISDELRLYLADVLDGKVKRPNNRIASAATEIRNREMMFHLETLRAEGVKNAEDTVAETFGVDRRTVQRAWSKLSQDWDRRIERLERKRARDKK